ncbi:MAG: tRNA (N6-isopentenyl adenosine(37)-C2)-methylthiotransferase MiaB [Deltaproteobacteria bacterium]|nr:tRNA (N6-isopentenyl adenosine(37)-C2)-methylthiotransferase MiaB [Deltaproteobacteria bacterium]
MANERRTFFIETFGCQMNDHDSEIMAQLLTGSYRPVLNVNDADIVLVNTCSIREKAEQKAMSLLGCLKIIKKDKPHMVIGIVGCVAQQEGKKILSRLPYVDLVMGTQNLYNLPALLGEIIHNHKRIAAVEQSAAFEIPPYLPEVDKGSVHKRFVTIMQGCNNFCTYCVVPFTRGREISRKFKDIIAEVRHLAAHGVREITLLGQNVNSYGRDLKSGQTGFAELLRAAAEVEGLKRLRFTTSNPRDLNDELIQCFADLDILCPHFHLPVQSGANSILKRMNRKYSIETYLDLVRRLRAARPDIAITTDIIVGFPGESEDDFQATMNLVANVRYHGAYSFKYSDRPQARSTAFTGKLSEEVKGERLARLQKRIGQIVMARNQEYTGKNYEVMVEGRNKSRPDQWFGRTASNHIVNFTGAKSLQAGQIIDVKVIEACQHSLRGILR